jgi:hypothetical protein
LLLVERAVGMELLMEILRCLKRYIARETFHALRADLEALNGT